VIHNYSSPCALSHIEAAAVLEALGQSLLVLDADGCVTYASSDARRLLGAPVERLRGRPFHHLFAESRRLHSEVLRLLHDDPAENCTLDVTEIATAGRVLRLRLSVIDDTENMPHVLVQLRVPRASRRSPTVERAPQKLPESVVNGIFAA
jgi:PAS domain-containing protein